MAVIIGAIRWIIVIFTSLVQILVKLLESVIALILLIPRTAAILTTSIGYLPTIIATFAILSVSISVIYLVVGRSHE